MLTFKKDEDLLLQHLKDEIARLKSLIVLKDTAINECSLKLEEEMKANAKLKNFRIKIISALGLIGANYNDELVIKEVKKLREKELL